VPPCGRKTAERVEQAIRRLNYQPDRLAARLARAREYRFCFVLPEGTNAFMHAGSTMPCGRKRPAWCRRRW
jgi:DNA-binding LacI/PurR family transcriptional regulator